ncbi:MAG: 6,7-dimethyl-8-ribityllumazine synthase, partial [Candidatus Gracilibacteria bacterium]|nr:6,7-dimethyl-8-ribityllumazine synthase [Candidatus Gracilibacteria bacterium]
LANKIWSEKRADLFLCFGVVVQGETPHFDYICAESARGLMTLTTQYTTPIINGILTCYKEEQVVERIKPVYAISGLNTLIAYQK